MSVELFDAVKLSSDELFDAIRSSREGLDRIEQSLIEECNKLSRENFSRIKKYVMEEPEIERGCAVESNRRSLYMATKIEEALYKDPYFDGCKIEFNLLSNGVVCKIIYG
jgi:hypothetical protein